MQGFEDRRRFLFAGAGAGLAAWFGRSAPAFAADPLKLTYGETEGRYWMVPYVASAKGMWKKAGLDVTTVVFPDARDGLDALFAGRLDCCIATDASFVYAALRGLKPRILACYSSTAKGSSIAVRSDRIKTPADLKGKTVATLVGSEGHYFLTCYLAYYNVLYQDLKIINMQPSGIVSAFDRGDVDALASDTQTARKAKNQGGRNIALLDTSDSAKYFGQYFLMLSADELVQKYHNTCDEIVVALQKAIDFIRANPDDAVKIAAAREKVSLEDAHESLLEFNHQIRFDEHMIDGFVRQANFAFVNKLATPPATDIKYLFQTLCYVDGAQKAVPGSVNL